MIRDSRSARFVSSKCPPGPPPNTSPPPIRSRRQGCSRAPTSSGSTRSSRTAPGSDLRVPIRHLRGGKDICHPAHQNLSSADRLHTEDKKCEQSYWPRLLSLSLPPP